MGRKPPEMDSPWSWVIVFAISVSSFILGGFVKAFGIFFAAFSEKFETSASSTSLIVGTRAAMYTIFAPIAAALSEKYSERVVLIGSALFSSVGCMVAAFAPNFEVIVFSTGILMGIGLSSFFAPIQIAIGKYFDKRKSIAISMSFMGFCISQIVMAPVNIIMLETYALSGTLILYSGLLLHILVAAALIRPVKRTTVSRNLDPVKEKDLQMEELDPVQEPLNSNLTNNHTKTGKSDEDPECANEEMLVKENGATSSEINPPANKVGICVKIKNALKQVLDFSLLKNEEYLVYACACGLAVVCFGNIPIYFFPRAADYGLLPKESALLLTILGCTDLISRVLQGIFGDIKKIGPKILFTVGIFCYGIAAAVVPVTSTFLEMAIVSGFLGLFGSATIVLSMPILVDIVGVQKLSKAVALTSFFTGITNAVGPPLLGYIKDATTSYNFVYIAFAGCLFLATSFMAVLPLLRCCGRLRVH